MTRSPALSASMSMPTAEPPHIFVQDQRTGRYGAISGKKGTSMVTEQGPCVAHAYRTVASTTVAGVRVVPGPTGVDTSARQAPVACARGVDSSWVGSSLR